MNTKNFMPFTTFLVGVNLDRSKNKLKQFSEISYEDYNFFGFVRGDVSKLFILGKPGAGKTTLSNYFKEAGFNVYHADQIRLDLIAKNQRLSRKEYLKEYSKKINEIAQTDEHCIIEGMGALRIDRSFMKKQAIIIINRPTLSCIISFVRTKYKETGCTLAYLIWKGIQLNIRWGIQLIRFKRELKDLI
jgi:hypothetical protein